MPALKDTKTEANLKEAFAGESQANRRYLYFAQKADVEGYPDVAALFRSVAEGETGHAFGHGTEEGGDVGVALHVGLLGEVEIAAIGLALAREGFLEVRLGFGAFQRRHRRSFDIRDGGVGC